MLTSRNDSKFGLQQLYDHLFGKGCCQEKGVQFQPFSCSAFWHLCWAFLQGSLSVQLCSLDAYSLWQAPNHIIQSVETLSGFQLIQGNTIKAQFWSKNKRLSIVPLGFRVMRWSSTEQAYRSTWLYLYKFSGLSSSTYKLAYLKQALLKGFRLSWSADGCCWSSCSSLDLICWCLRARVAAHVQAVSEIRQSYS